MKKTLIKKSWWVLKEQAKKIEAEAKKLGITESELIRRKLK